MIWEGKNAMTGDLGWKLRQYLKSQLTDFFDISPDIDSDSHMRNATEKTLAEIQRRLAQLIVQHHNISKDLDARKQTIRAADNEAENALISGEEAKARRAVAQKVAAASQLYDLNAEHIAIKTDIELLEDLIARFHAAPRGAEFDWMLEALKEAP